MYGKVYIYALVDARDGQVFYVGSTSYPERRYKAYLKRTPHSFGLNHVLGEMRRIGIAPEMKILDETNDSKRNSVEAEWIRKLKAEGAPLVNVTCLKRTTVWHPDEPEAKYKKISTSIYDYQRDAIDRLVKESDSTLSEVVCMLIGKGLIALKQ